MAVEVAMSEGSPSTAGRASTTGRIRQGLDDRTRKTIFAGGSALGALAMSSCCIVPLVLFSLGITGAWIGNLAALYPYKAYFFIATAGFLGGGFYMAYRKPKAADCEAGRYCATALSERINKVVLWASTVLVLAALGFPYYAPLLLES
ncbi:MAG: mercuric transporter MerT family protein [Kiloniellaceae bacterium]